MEYARRSLHSVENFSFLILTFLNTKSQFAVLQSFYQIMRQLSVKLNFSVDFSRLRKWFLFQISFSGVFIPTTEFVILIFERKRNSGVLKGLYDSLNVFSTLICIFPGFLYAFYVELFNLHLKVLREILEDTLYTSNDLINIYNTLVVIKSVKNLKREQERSKKFSTIISIHLALYEIHKQINYSLGKVMTFYFVHMTFMLIFHGYCIYEGSVYFRYLGSLVVRVITMSFRLILLISIVRTTEKHQDEVNELENVS